MKTVDRVFTLPNLLSGSRILIVPFLIWMIFSGRLLFAIALFGLGLATDYLDGYLARNYSWVTNLGKVLDPAADKLLMSALFIPRLVVIPFEGWWWWTPWLFVPLLIEEAILVFGGAFAFSVKNKSNKLGSNIYGKLKFTGEGALGVLLLIFPKSVYNSNWLAMTITLILALVTFFALKSIIGHLREWREVCTN